MSLVMMYKHSSFPDIPVDSTLLFQFFLFVYGIISMGLQYVNIYRTVWWLPHSHAVYGLNFDMIDFYLVVILILIMVIKLFSIIFAQIWTAAPVSKIKQVICRSGQCFLVLVVGVAVGYVLYHMAHTYSLTDGLFLCYPVLVYILLFWTKIRKLVLPDHESDDDSSRKNMKNGSVPEHTFKLNDCSVTPELIRNDIELLKTDFNSRIKEILFHSLMTTYYMTVIPVSFAQTTLYYDPWWVSQHVIVVWFTSFLFCATHYLPPVYVDNLHQHALFLGKWQIVQGRNAHVPYNAWSELQVWPQGSLVKHVRGLFKAVGLHNTAEPGNGMHIRFSFLFSDPLRICNWMTILSGVLVLYQLVVLIYCTEWNHIVNITMLLFCNYFLLFRLMRNRFVLTRTYSDRRLIKISQ